MIKRLMLINFIVLVLACSAGCAGRTARDTATETVSGENFIDIYYPEGFSILKTQDRYQLMQPDLLPQSVEEVMTQLMTVYQGRLENYSYLLDEENNLSIELRINGEYSREEELLYKSSISRTLFQLPDIHSIQMEVENGTGRVTSKEAFTRDSFYSYDQ